ncbi:MipA/OmpV family protein [Ancylobacter sp. 6x-1]|uniref:MipA/OmpV family protein n=1 Tax=Ancylobacter crimeensis TaxID=2579147 RepID=A0ABT0DAG1_9HYPH|nr:MipA/OmpV family protein [Ancylobacter crimeensis]MCK0196879.1 MipA/OmpV family protein [Ancylobacter crimeensis]
MRSAAFGLAVLAGAAAWSVAAAPVAHAADMSAGVPAVEPAPVVDRSREWTLTVGAYFMGQPEFAGADSYEFAVRPLFSISRAGSLDDFRSFYDNASIALIDTGNFQAGVVGKLNWRRKSSDYDGLRGLDNVDYAVEVGGYAQIFPADWMRLRGEVRYGFGGFDGVVADLAADFIYRPNVWGLTFSAGPRITLASSGYTDAYFGISDQESANAIALGNNLTPYEAGGGIYSYGVGGQVLKDFGNGFKGSVYAEYRYLADEAANSPIVVQNGDRNQVQAGVSLSYTFFLGFDTNPLTGGR